MFHHHVAVCVFAHAFAATRRADQQQLATNRAVLAAHLSDTSEKTGEGAHRGTDLAPTSVRSRKPFPGGES